MGIEVASVTPSSSYSVKKDLIIIRTKYKQTHYKSLAWTIVYERVDERSREICRKSHGDDHILHRQSASTSDSSK